MLCVVVAVSPPKKVLVQVVEKKKSMRELESAREGVVWGSCFLGIKELWKGLNRDGGMVPGSDLFKQNI